MSVAEPSPIPEPRERASRLGRICAQPFVWGILLYRITLSPMIGRQCRYSPTCSAYGLEAYRSFGPITGTRLTLTRVLRCHPLSRRSGYDPVPVATDAGKQECL